MHEQKNSEAVEDALRGQPFIGSSISYDKPPETWKRKCELCFFRYGHDRKDYFPKTKKPDCSIVAGEKKTPHALFGFKKTEYLPEQIGGKEVGNYCPHFLPFTAE